MNDDPPAVTGPEDPLVQIVSTEISAARVYDYFMGGTDNFAVDRETAAQVARNIGGMENVRAGLYAQRTFQDATLRHLAGEANVRQFLDIGSGIPSADNSHAVAQQVAPASRIVYVDCDPLVLAHAHSLLKSTPEGATAFIAADLRDPERILRHAAATLDLAAPIVVVLVAILHVIEDQDDPYGIVARLLDAVASGSYLVISHATADIQTEEMIRLAEHLRQIPGGSLVLRDRTGVARFFDGLELVQPGLVPLDQWLRWHDPARPRASYGGWQPPYYVGVGVKP